MFYDNHHMEKNIFNYKISSNILKRRINDTTKNTLIKYNNLSPPDSTVKLVCGEYN